jgi:hypothetical protein
MTTQGYIEWAQHEGERFKRIFITPKGQKQLTSLSKAK